MKVSFITTVFNEEKTIDGLLNSLFAQTHLPDEIIIVDGGSTDHTVVNIKYQISNIKNNNVKFKVLVKKGNRSVGRNEAIKNVTGDIIVCSDAGNILDKKWIENIIKPFKNKSADVVAGYYKGKASNIFQKCLIPYVLVMPDKINPENFLPATRSMAFKKSIWKKVGRFDEKYSHNEDYVFAKKLKKIKAKIIFAKDAVVYWLPRNSFKQAFTMFYRFAFGDAEANILRYKVLFIISRYIIGLLIILFALLLKSSFLLILFFALIATYVYWSIWKNYKYVKNYKAIFILPSLQFISDAAVIVGTISGALQIFFIRWVTMFLLLAFVIFLPFRYLRNMFPLPEIGNKKIVGFAQYYGYPFYFETILFFVFVALPIITFVFAKQTLKNEK